MPKVRIVVVDDEEDIGFIFKFHFKEEIKKDLISLEFFSNPMDANNKILESDEMPYDLIITDMNMPEMGGITLLENVKGKYDQMITYILTAYDTASHYKDAEDLGVNRFISKPLSFEDLKDAIHQDFKIY